MELHAHLAFAAVALVSCSAMPDERAPARDQVATVAATRDWVILSASTARATTAQCSRAVPDSAESTWLPTEDDARLAHAAILRTLERELSKIRWLPQLRRPTANQYRVQFAGLVVNGRRIIYVNGFHEGHLDRLADVVEDRTAWLREAIIVCDGGEGYFGAEIDPRSYQVSQFHFNGIG